MGKEMKGCVLIKVGIDDFNNFISRGECLDLPMTMKVSRGPKPFKFFNCWPHHKDFHIMVKENWSEWNNLGIDSAAMNLKLRKLKLILKDWNKNVFGSIDQKLINLDKKVKDIDLLSNMRCLFHQD
ncbi:hypothetical protein REPUB_Repub13aG0013700 [Reevesia pubescens]